MRPVLEFLTVNVIFAIVAAAIAGAFFVAYSAVVALDLPDVPHGVLGVGAVAISVAAGFLAAKLCDRVMNGRIIRRRP